MTLNLGSHHLAVPGMGFFPAPSHPDPDNHRPCRSLARRYCTPTPGLPQLLGLPSASTELPPRPAGLRSPSGLGARVHAVLFLTARLRVHGARALRAPSAPGPSESLVPGLGNDPAPRGSLSPRPLAAAPSPPSARRSAGAPGATKRGSERVHGMRACARARA